MIYSIEHLLKFLLNAMMRNSRAVYVFRELSEGVRQRQKLSELAFEQSAEITVGQNVTARYSGRVSVVPAECAFLRQIGVVTRKFGFRLLFWEMEAFYYLIICKRRI